MLPKKRRLTARQVREVISLGRGIKGSSVSLKYLARPGFFGAAVVAPKALARRATDRNRIRRTVYRTLSSLPLKERKALEGVLVVFFIRSVPSPLLPTLKSDIADILIKLPHTHV
ncbi:MAG: hypothetical protein G01um101456_332 [Parcubacteria group bacterium Gr01-1014_56]|nr:MAG: hypothetical protein G01um101456_332 [Parcubacteria group bacterium Gr01-1014_56]